MAKASDIAVSLRGIADHYEALGDLELVKPRFEFNCLGESKEAFLAAARTIPRPCAKNYGREGDPYSFICVKNTGESLDVEAFTMRSTVCKVKVPARPAEYECPSIFSPEEEAELEQA